MAKYRIEEKPDFTVTGIGVELKSSNTDFVGLAAEKQAFEQKVIGNGTIDALRQAAENHYFFTVNEPYNGKMMYYVGVQPKNQQLKQQNKHKPKTVHQQKLRTIQRMQKKSRIN